MINVLTIVLRDNAIVFLGASAVVAAIGVFVQLRFTGFKQILNNKTPIRYEKRKPKRKLLKEEGLYNNLEGATKELEELLKDIKLHPKRYFRILSKKEIPYNEN